MNAMRIERHGRRRQYNRKRWGFSVMLAFMMIMMCTWLYAFGILTPLIFRLVGVDYLGATGDVFADVSPVPTVIVDLTANEPRQVTVDMGTLGQETIANSADVTTLTGETMNGARVAVASFTEDGLIELCSQRSVICRSGNDLYRNVSVDLRPGGAVIYADVNAGLYWQRIGVVAQLDSTNTQFYVAGVDVSGMMYDPSTLPFELNDLVTDAISQIEREGNRTLQDLAISAGGERYRLTEVNVDDTILTLILR
jgi:hypothetical protein